MTCVWITPAYIYPIQNYCVTCNGLSPFITKINNQRYVFDCNRHQFIPFDGNIQDVLTVVVPLVIEYVVPFVKEFISGLH